MHRLVPLKRARPTLVLALLFSSACSPVLFAAAPSGYYLVWNDEFNGSSLDTTKWAYRLPGPYRDAYNTPSAVSFNGSNLVITIYTSGGTNFSAMLYAHKKFESKYGYWESSIKWADSNGEWSAFWMLPPSESYSPGSIADLSEPQVAGSEIDTCEHRYVDSSNVNNIANYIEINLHWYAGSTTQVSDPGSGDVPTSGGLATGFHTYGFLWTSNAYSFLVDGSQVYTAPSSPVSHSAEYPLLTSAVDDTSTTWAGYIPTGGYGSLATSATKMTVDYVRYYAPTNVLFWTGASTAFWNNSASWLSNMSPASNSDLTFSYLSGSVLSTTPGQNYSIDGLIILTTSGSVSINGVNTLTLGPGGIDMVAANNAATIDVPIIVAAPQTWGVGLNSSSSAANTLTLNGSLSGTNALTKSCYGTLILNGANTFSGPLNVDTGSSSNNDGALEITSSAALADVASPISIRNTGTGSSTFQLDPSSGGILVPQTISLAGRSTNSIAIENVTGSNTLAGGITLAAGGSYYLLQSDAGTLTLGGTISAGSTATGARTITFQGGGNFAISGSIQNGSASAMSVIKTNSGALTFSGTNTYTGATTNLLGNLFVNGSLAGPLIVSGGTLGGAGAIGGATTIQSGAELSPGASGAMGALTFGNSLTLAPGSTTWMEINAALQTNDQLQAAGALTCGGTLVVTNLAGTLAPGDSFKLFNAGSYAGNFAAVVLPPLNAGLAWNTNGLTGGVLSIISVAPPETIDITGLGGDQLQLNWSYGMLQSATNIAGPYQDITNASSPCTIPTTNARQFYRVREN